MKCDIFKFIIEDDIIKLPIKRNLCSRKVGQKRSYRHHIFIPTHTNAEQSLLLWGTSRSPPARQWFSQRSDPLHVQNGLRYFCFYLVSTDTLRKLLPTGDPSVKMKIDMANLEGVADMVKEEINWLHGEIDVRDENIK